LLQRLPPVDTQTAFTLVSVVRTISRPRRAAYSRILSRWFSVEYCWCSVDIRTYSAARTEGACATTVSPM
jgi:hypothetical protein